MSEQRTNIVVFVEGTCSAANVLAQLLYLGLKYGHGFVVIMKLSINPLNEQSC